MAFATPADMLARFGHKEVVQLTDRDFTGAINDLVLQGGLDTAAGEISGYLAGRYQLPFAVVPTLLVGYACDIARYRLTGAEVQCTQDIETRYSQAIKYLTLVGRGEISLGIDTTGAVVGGGSGGASGVRVTQGVRKFDANALKGY